MKTTLILSALLASFKLFSQDIYFGPLLTVSISDSVLFKGNLKVDNANILTFNADSKSKFNQNLEIVTGVVDSDGKFIFENTAEKTVKGILKIDTISLISNAKLDVANAVTFQANDLLDLNGQIKTGGINVTLGESVSNPGVLNYSAGYINGNMKRWFSTSTISDVLFPFGTSGVYSPAKVSYTSAPNGGSLTGNYILNSNTVFPINITDGFDVLENLSGDGFWQFTPADGLSTGTYSLNLTTNNLYGVNDPLLLHLLKRPTSNAAWDQNWVAEGTHVASSESAGFYTVIRTDITSFSQFGIASPTINPLPVELVYFNGVCNEGFSILNWQTASENNTAHYEVERSSNGTDWSTIGELDAAGNSTDLINYSFQDPNRSSGVTYFQLKQFDLDGNYKVYGPLSTSCTDLSVNVEVYPNPINDKGFVKINSTSNGLISVQITENTGKIITEFNTNVTNGETSIPFDLSSNTSGVYFLKINLNNDIIIKKINKL